MERVDPKSQLVPFRPLTELCSWVRPHPYFYWNSFSNINWRTNKLGSTVFLPENLVLWFVGLKYLIYTTVKHTPQLLPLISRRIRISICCFQGFDLISEAHLHSFTIWVEGKVELVPRDQDQKWSCLHSLVQILSILQVIPTVPLSLFYKWRSNVHNLQKKAVLEKSFSQFPWVLIEEVCLLQGWSCSELYAVSVAGEVAQVGMMSWWHRQGRISRGWIGWLFMWPKLKRRAFLVPGCCLLVPASGTALSVMLWSREACRRMHRYKVWTPINERTWREPLLGP